MFCKNKTNIAKRKKTISKHPFFYHEAIPLPYLYPLSFPISSILSIPPPAKSRRRDKTLRT